MNRLLSIIAVALLVACPLIPLASDDSVAAADAELEEGFYFEFKATEEEFYELATTVFQKTAIGAVLYSLMPLFNTDFIKFFDSGDSVSFDTCHIKFGTYGHLTGDKIEISNPLVLEFTNVELTAKAKSNISIFNTESSSWSEEMSKYLSGFSVSTNDNITITTDKLTIEVADFTYDTYTEISEGYAVTNEYSTTMPSVKRPTPTNKVTINPCGCKADFNLKTDNLNLDIDYDYKVVRYFDTDTDFQGTKPSEATESTKIKYILNDLVMKGHVSLTVSDGKKTMSENVAPTEDDIEYLKGLIEGSEWSLMKRVVDLTKIAKTIQTYKIGNYIQDDKNDEQAIVKKILAMSGGKCSIDVSEAKDYCEKLNKEIISPSSGSALDPVVVIAIVGVTILAVLAFGVVIIGSRR